MTYSNFSISTGKTVETLVGHRQTQLNVLATRKKQKYGTDFCSVKII